MRVNNAPTLSQLKEKLKQLTRQADELKQLQQDFDFTHKFGMMVLKDTELN